VRFPTPEFCTDNAAMIASCAYFNPNPIDPRDVEITPSKSSQN